MTYVPQYMQHYDQFCKEREAVQSLNDWNAFYKKWLDNSAWPTKSAETLREEGIRKRGPVSIGGRIWGFTNFNDDISAEARYEYIYTLRTIGDPIKFPHEKDVARLASEGFSQQCPYCEISTSEIGDNVCPQCGRQLVFVRSAN